MKFPQNILLALVISSLGGGCVLTAPENGMDNSSVTSNRTSNNSSSKVFKKSRPAGVINLVAKRDINLRGMVEGDDNIARISISSTSYTIAMAIDEFKSRNYTVSVPIPRDGDAVEVTLYGSDNEVLEQRGL